MKWPGYIFSLYLLVLTAIPCCSFNGCPDDETTSNQAASHENESGNKDRGVCSPFFSCGSCGFVTIAREASPAIVILLPLKQQYSVFIPAIIEDIHYDFWQPPQLS